LIFAIAVIILLWWFLNTELGYSVRATGNNVYMIRAMGVDTDKMFMIGLIIGNAMIGLAGALIAQNQSYADIGMGTGTIVIGLASVIIGEVLFGKRKCLQHMVFHITRSIAYRIIISLVLEIDFKIKIAGLIIPISVEPTDLKLFTSVIVAFALSLPVIKQLSAGKKASKTAKS
jgi:putative ABC transport system permease protein